MMYEKWLKNEKSCEAAFKKYFRKDVLIKITDSSWVKRHIEKSNHNIDFASFLFDLHKTLIGRKFKNQNFYDWCISGYYYACYHAALALIAKTKLKSKSHLATMCAIIDFYFHKHTLLKEKDIELLAEIMIKRKDIEEVFELKNLRERVSYGTSTKLESELVNVAREKAIHFINKAKEILEVDLEKITDDEKKILALIKRNTSIEDIAEKLQLTTRAIEDNISKLKQKGLLKRIGPAKGSYWELKK